MNSLIVVAQGVQDEEFIYPYYRLQEEGNVDVVFISTSSYSQPIGKYGVPFKPTIDLKDISVDQYDCLIIPGGWQCPEILRMDERVLDLTRMFFRKDKVIGAICHGPQVLISAGIFKTDGIYSTGYKGIADDLKNAGALYLDREVVISKDHIGILVTSPHYRNNTDFIKSVIDECKIQNEQN